MFLDYDINNSSSREQHLGGFHLLLLQYLWPWPVWWYDPNLTIARHDRRRRRRRMIMYFVDFSTVFFFAASCVYAQSVSMPQRQF